MGRKAIQPIFMLLVFISATIGIGTISVADKERTEITILDRTGERWDVGQAASIGFDPGKFQYGIGRHAFTTLDDSHLQSATITIPTNLRVIGVAAGKEAQAYSVSKLSRHETANMTLDSEPILVGY